MLNRWKYCYTNVDGWRIYKLWQRDNKRLSVLHLRRYKDDLSDHLNWEIWESPLFSGTEDEAEKCLRYVDGGIYGHDFLQVLQDAITPKVDLKPLNWEEYKLQEDWDKETEEHWAKLDDGAKYNA
jgi:hypothetical protein